MPQSMVCHCPKLVTAPESLNLCHRVDRYRISLFISSDTFLCNVLISCRMLRSVCGFHEGTARYERCRA